MTKPFELKALGQKFVAELKKVAVPATSATLDWVSESCLMVNSPIVKGIGGVIVAVKPQILAEVEKAVA